MGFLLWLETNAFTGWVLTTGWVYPWTISFHSIGMGFLVGVIYMLSLRVLGFGRFPVAGLEWFLIIVRIAVTVSLATGILLFMLDADRFFFSPTFRVKLLMIVLGGISAWILTHMVFRDGVGVLDRNERALAPKLVAGVTIVCWTGAIVAGRLTAYLP